MYEILAIKNNKQYRVLNLEDSSFKVINREQCLQLAKNGLLVNATYVNGSLRGKGCNLRLLNNLNSIKSKERQVSNCVTREIIANALFSWVYENDDSDIIKCFSNLETVLSGILYRGMLLHKSKTLIGSVINFNTGNSSWTTDLNVAKTFADVHLDHAKEERFDLDGDISDYCKCILHLSGTFKGVDIVSKVIEFKDLLEEDVIELAEDECEVLFHFKNNRKLRVVKVDKIKDYYNLYCNIT